MARIDSEYEQHMQMELDHQYIEDQKWDEFLEMAKDKGLVVVPQHMVKVQ